MKKIFTILLLSTILLTNGVAQKISATDYNKVILHEDFSDAGENFPIVTTTDNYFILDKGDYLLSRNNEDSEYAIIASNSSANNFVLKTAIRIGPSNNKKSSIGIIIKAQQGGTGAIIFEINKKGEYRIKQLLGNAYKNLTGDRKQKGWVKNKIINGVDKYNFVEIRTENNVYDVYVNSNYLTTFFIADYESGLCGLIISPETKARIDYYYVNTKGDNEQSLAVYSNPNTTNINTNIEELNKKIKILEENNAKLNDLNTQARGNQDEKINALTQKNIKLTAATIKQEKEITNLKIENSSIKEIERTISNNTALISKLGTEKNTLSNDIVILKKTIVNLKIKNTELALVSADKEKEITNLKSSNSKIEKLEKTISDNVETQLKLTVLINKIDSEKSALIDDVTRITEETTLLNTKLTNTIKQDKEIATLKSKNTNLASVTINQEKEIAKLKSKNTEFEDNLSKINNTSNKRIKQLISEVNSLKLAKTNLSADLTKEKNTNIKNKKELSKLVKHKTAEINELDIALNNAKNQIKSINKASNNLKECAANSANLSTNLKQVENELGALRKTQGQHDEEKSELNGKIEVLTNQLNTTNTELVATNTANTELKKLFFLKDFELNGVKPSELTKQTKTYPIPKELKGNSTIYAVQFGVYMQVQPYASLKGLDEVWYETTELGTYVYLSGEFKSPQQATAHKNSLVTLGYPNAFVVTLTK